MRTGVVEALARGSEYEFARDGPPENFLRMPDIPGGRYTRQEFFNLEQPYMWSRTC